MKGEAMSMKLWSAKLMAGLALVAGLAMSVTPSGSAQEAAEDVLIERHGPGPEIKAVEALDVIKLKADAAKMAAEGVQKKIVMLHSGHPDKMHSIREAAAAL